MSEISDTIRTCGWRKLQDFLAARRGLLKDYLSAISGSAGRLVFSLLYFIALANALSIADFGLFATASAAGVMLSRILAFGFVSSLYRIAAVRPRLIGVSPPASCCCRCCRCRCWRPRHGRHSPCSLRPCRPAPLST